MCNQRSPQGNVKQREKLLTHPQTSDERLVNFSKREKGLFFGGMKCRKRSSQFEKTYKGIAKTPTKQPRTMGVKFTRWTLQKLNLLILSPFPSSPTNMFTFPFLLHGSPRQCDCIVCLYLHQAHPGRRPRWDQRAPALDFCRFLELHRFADKDDSCPKKVGVSIWGLGKKRRKRSLVARILLFWHC